MDYKKARVGMEVYIKHDISITSERHSSGPQMHEMCGKKYKIQEVSRNGKSIRINDWNWATEDVELCDVTIKIDSRKFCLNTKPQMFNPEKL